MNVLVASNKYLKIYSKLFVSTASTFMAYRLNFVIQSLYGPAYVLVMYALLAIAYSKTPTLGGWSKPEGQLLFLVFQWLFVICMMMFMKGSRHFLWNGFRQGELDIYLTKPAKPQFFVLFSKPELEQGLLTLALTVLLVWHATPYVLANTWLGNLGFVVMLLFGWLTTYFSVAIYTAAGFYMTRAGQIIELYNKISDFAQYPMVIFPVAFQLLADSIVPMAFFSYYPTLFLLGQGKVWHLGLALTATTILAVFNSIIWSISLKRYSSASS